MLQNKTFQIFSFFCRVGKGAQATCPPIGAEWWARFALPTLRFGITIFIFFCFSFNTFAVPVVDVSQDSTTVDQPLVKDQSNNLTIPQFNTKGLNFEQRLARLEQIAAQQSQTQAIIAQLQQQIEQLQGSNDVLRHELETLRNQQQSFYKDLNIRLMALEKPVVAQSAATSVVTASTPSATAINAAEQTAYQQAYNLISAQKYDQAIAGLQAFIKQYPSSTLIPSALYWQGEVLLMQGKSAQARALFTQIIKNYPKSNKAPSAQAELNKLK